jgi:chromate transporter
MLSTITYEFIQDASHASIPPLLENSIEARISADASLAVGVGDIAPTISHPFHVDVDWPTEEIDDLRHEENSERHWEEVKVDESTGSLSYRDLFVVFFKAGMAFGGGLGIMAALEEELVQKRRVVDRQDFLAVYSMGRLIPSGTMTAVAVAYGHRFGGWIGTVVAVVALVLPSTILTLLLTMAYGMLHDGPFLTLLSRSLLPAALALITATALKFGKDVSRSKIDITIAVAAFAATQWIAIHPSLVLPAGGLAGLIVGILASKFGDPDGRV